jgi:hypothetical protein
MTKEMSRILYSAYKGESFPRISGLKKRPAKRRRMGRPSPRLGD